ncbi:MAG: hypothetical protein RR687_00945 [Comamonas sp.]
MDAKPNGLAPVLQTWMAIGPLLKKKLPALYFIEFQHQTWLKSLMNQRKPLFL